MVQLGASSHTNKKPCHDESSKRAIYLTPKHLTCIIPLVEDHPPIWKMQPTKHTHIYIYYPITAILPYISTMHIIYSHYIHHILSRENKKGKETKSIHFQWMMMLSANTRDNILSRKVRRCFDMTFLSIFWKLQCIIHHESSSPH